MGGGQNISRQLCVQFTVDHALTCAGGGFGSLRHNEIRDLTASLLTEGCHNAKTEPKLQKLTGEALTQVGEQRRQLETGHLCNGCLGAAVRTHFLMYVRVCNSLAPRIWPMTPNACYRRHKRETRKAYEQWVCEVEHGTFASLVFFATGGMRPMAVVVFKQSVRMIADRSNQQ